MPHASQTLGNRQGRLQAPRLNLAPKRACGSMNEQLQLLTIGMVLLSMERELWGLHCRCLRCNPLLSTSLKMMTKRKRYQGRRGRSPTTWCSSKLQGELQMTCIAAFSAGLFQRSEQVSVSVLTLQKYNLKGHLTGKGGRPVCPSRALAGRRFPHATLPQLASLTAAVPDDQPTLPQVLQAPFQLPIFHKLLTLAVISSR